MGMFPYNCPKCNGGYSRCGQGPDCPNGDEDGTPCKGGQFCWQDDCVAVLLPWHDQPFLGVNCAKKEEFIKTLPKVIYGKYSGYGNMTPYVNPCKEKIEIHDITKARYIPDWIKDSEENDVINVVASFWCSACYNEVGDEDGTLCKGGQFCRQDDCVAVLLPWHDQPFLGVNCVKKGELYAREELIRTLPKVISGKYSDHGIITAHVNPCKEKIEIYDITKARHISDWIKNSGENDVINVVAFFWCSACYNEVRNHHSSKPLPKKLPNRNKNNNNTYVKGNQLDSAIKKKRISKDTKRK